MKNYIKPEIKNVNLSANCDIASAGLSGWLDDNDMQSYEDSITTFQYNS